MADFTSDFWNLYVAGITLLSIVGCGVFLFAQTKRRAGSEQVSTTGHVWDDDLAEYNNPMPRWWVWLFYLTIVFSLVYLVFYPGLGSFSGSFGWSSQKQFDEEMAKANQQFGPLYDKYLKMDLTAVAADTQAQQMGQRLFLNHCAQCHGTDGGGSRGFPSLRDSDWLWGGTPELIKTSIADGRMGVMPPMGAAVGTDEDVQDVANYVLSLSGRTHDQPRAQRGKEKFVTCAACHGAEGKGNQALGAPDLTDKIWLYGGSEAAIIEVITKGRNGIMPPQRELLGDAKVHLLAAYVLRLSKGEAASK
jgi:cytochrome c oxidase cbb3-type subunit III